MTKPVSLMLVLETSPHKLTANPVIPSTKKPRMEERFHFFCAILLLRFLKQFFESAAGFNKRVIPNPKWIIGRPVGWERVCLPRVAISIRPEC